MGFKDTLAGTGYVVLNIIRGFNIICMLLVMAAAMVMVVKTIMVSDFYIFDGITHVLIFFYAAFLLITEVGVFSRYFAKDWPLLSIEHGFTTLGLLMITISVSVLGNLNKDATSPEKIGAGFYELVEAAGILTLIAGVTNILANYIFRKHREGVTARMIRAHGKQALRMANDAAPVPPVLNAGDKYATSSVYSSPSMRSQRTVAPTNYGISAPMPTDPEQFAKFETSEDIRRPDSVMHPALRGNAF